MTLSSECWVTHLFLTSILLFCLSFFLSEVLIYEPFRGSGKVSLSYPWKMTVFFFFDRITAQIEPWSPRRMASNHSDPKTASSSQKILELICVLRPLTHPIVSSASLLVGYHRRCLSSLFPESFPRAFVQCNHCVKSAISRF